MLDQILTTKPLPKFVLIQDTYENKQTQLLQWIIHYHVTKNSNNIHLWVYLHENDIYKMEKNPPGVISFCQQLNIVHKQIREFHGQVPCFLCGNLEFEVDRLEKKSLVVIDSLADLVHEKGLGHCVEKLQELINNKNIVQIVAILHRDVFETDHISKSLAFISTLNIHAIDNNIVEYTYKKYKSKVTRKMVKLLFNANNELHCQQFDQNNVKSSPVIEPTIKPDEMSTFKISLRDSEIEARKNLVLPYLKNEESKGKPNITIGSTSGGKIIYLPDDNDDFDDEDPDNDLNI